MEEKKGTKKNGVGDLVYIQSYLKAPKNQRNTFGGYNYRSCEDILEAVKPLLYDVNCALTISDDIIQVADRIYVKATATLRTLSGETFSNTAFAREAVSKKGMDESQVTGAASSYARKYALNGLFCIDDTKDADALNVSKEYTQQPAPEPSQNLGGWKQEMEACANTEQLTALWYKYPQLQSDKAFREAWQARNGQLNGK